MKHYVLNVIFNERLNVLVIIRKNRPEWQKGKLNFIGGKVEPGESFVDAAIRETKEETDIDVTGKIKFMGSFSDAEHGHYLVACFVSVTDDIYKFKSMTDEDVFMATIEDIRRKNEKFRMDNMLVLLELARMNALDPKLTFELKYL